MAKHDLSQRELGSMIGLEQSLVSVRLSGLRRWSLDDLDALHQAGVPICLPYYGPTDTKGTPNES